jgi:hypothetical protein
VKDRYEMLFKCNYCQKKQSEEEIIKKIKAHYLWLNFRNGNTLELTPGIVDWLLEPLFIEPIK